MRDQSIPVGIELGTLEELMQNSFYNVRSKMESRIEEVFAMVKKE